MKKLPLNTWVPMDKEHLSEIIESLEQILWSVPCPRMDIAIQSLDGSPQRSFLARQVTVPTLKEETISIVCAENFGERPPAISLSLRFVLADDGNDGLALFWQTESPDPVGEPAHNTRFLFVHADEVGSCILIQDWIDLVDHWTERWTHITVYERSAMPVDSLF